MTTKEQRIVEEMVENNIYEAISSMLRDLAHGMPTELIEPTTNKNLNKKIQSIIDKYRPYRHLQEGSAFSTII